MLKLRIVLLCLLPLIASASCYGADSSPEWIAEMRHLDAVDERQFAERFELGNGWVVGFSGVCMGLLAFGAFATRAKQQKDSPDDPV